LDKLSFGRPRKNGDDNIELNFMKTTCENVNCIVLSHSRAQRRALTTECVEFQLIGPVTRE
jgi:hypothetical protein